MSEATPAQPAAAPAAPDATEAPAGPPPRVVTLYLVRHGQTTFNVEHRLPGQLPDIHLTEEGIKQAQQLAEAARAMPLTMILSSPLERARATAEIVRGTRAIPLHFDARLMDTDVGPWAGQIISELAKNDPQWGAFVRHPTQPPAGIEGFYAVLARAVAVTEEARQHESWGNHIMLIAHADVIKLLIVHYLRLPIEGAPWLQIDNAAVTALTFTGTHGPALQALNWVPSPAWLFPPPEPAPSPTAVATATSDAAPATS